MTVVDTVYLWMTVVHVSGAPRRGLKRGLVLQPRGAIDRTSARSGGHVVIVAARTGGI